MSSKIRDVFDILNDRHEILPLLAEDALGQQQIIEQTAASQSTISRTLSRLQDLGIVSESDNQYELTLLGVLVHQKYETYVTEFEQLYSAQEILHDLPADVSLDPALLDGADITISKPHAPDAALSPILRLTREATTIKGVAPMVHAGYVKTFDDRMVQSDMEAEFIVTDAVADQSLKEYSDRDPTALRTGRLEMYKTDADLPYCLLLINTPDERHAGVVVNSDTGTHGTIINTDERAWKWAQKQYQQFKSAAYLWDLLSELDSSRS